jgi:hypothetical protein
LTAVSLDTAYSALRDASTTVYNVRSKAVKAFKQFVRSGQFGGATNRSISAKDPSDYIPALIADSRGDTLRHQDVPTDPALLQTTNYEEFLATRRALIAERLNAFLATAN